MTTYGNYREQFERMMRWYKRYEEFEQRHYEPYPEEIDHRELFLYISDDIHAFFLNCYHLKDWIKNDATVSQLVRDQVENFINANDCLQICADICNSIKHLKLKKKPRYGDVALLETLWVGVREDSKYIRVKSTILTDHGEQDAFEIAKECVKKWNEFIDTNF